MINDNMKMNNLNESFNAPLKQIIFDARFYKFSVIPRMNFKKIQQNLGIFKSRFIIFIIIVLNMINSTEANNSGNFEMTNVLT